jgi:hypothetical protein
MKTAKQAAAEIYLSCGMGDIFREDKATEVIMEVLKKFESEIRKDQDKITRHACAEEINLLENEPITDLLTDTDYLVINLNDASNAIMNTKAIKEEL